MKTRYTPKQKAQIVLEILKEERSIAQIASEYGVHPNQLYKWKAQAIENLPGLFEDDRKGEKALKAEHDRQLKELYAEIGKLTTQLSWLKKNLALNLLRGERLAMLERGSRNRLTWPPQRWKRLYPQEGHFSGRPSGLGLTSGSYRTIIDTAASGGWLSRELPSYKMLPFFIHYQPVLVQSPKLTIVDSPSSLYYNSENLFRNPFHEWEKISPIHDY